MDFQYEENGETKLSETYQVPVTVTGSEGSGIPVALVAGIVVVIVAIAGYLYYRRRE
jgi:LPXTG-motif cell wall-anchored protein